MIIQLLLIPSVVLAVVLSLRSRQTLRGQARRKIFAALTVSVGVVLVVFPNFLQAIADRVGVTRGVDLMFYVLVLVIIYMIGASSVRFREQEARMVRLVRAMALDQAATRRALLERPGTPGDQSSRRTSAQ